MKRFIKSITLLVAMIICMGLTLNFAQAEEMKVFNQKGDPVKVSIPATWVYQEKLVQGIQMHVFKSSKDKAGVVYFIMATKEKFMGKEDAFPLDGLTHEEWDKVKAALDKNKETANSRLVILKDGHKGILSDLQDEEGKVYGYYLYIITREQTYFVTSRGDRASDFEKNKILLKDIVDNVSLE